MSDPLDRPENPRIRTKINLFSPETDQGYFALVCKFAEQALSVDAYLEECLNYFQEKLASEEFEALRQKAIRQGGQFEILRRHIDYKRYTVLFYSVEHGEVHAPHHHHNVASTQILISGKLHLREFDRVERTNEGKLIARMTSERTLVPGDTFQASEWKNNIHWFEAIDGPALIFNTNARGFEQSTFEKSHDRFGRCYVDPTKVAEDGLIHCDEFDEIEAKARFGGTPLRNFPISV